MKKYLVSAALVALCGVALAQPFTPPPPPPLAPTDIKLPAKRMAVPVPALRQTRAHASIDPCYQCFNHVRQVSGFAVTSE